MDPHASPPSDTPEKIYRDNVDLITKLALWSARRHYASAEDAEDFAQELHLKLIADDYAVLRKFEWTSKLETYLAAVAANAFKDFQIQRRGKWRPSAAAKALGPVAVRLEELVYKEGWSLDEACEILLTNHHVPESRQQLEEIWERLRPRIPRQREGDGPPTDMPSTDPPPDVGIFKRELEETRARVAAALTKVMGVLPEEDRFIVTLVILQDIKIVTVARLLNTEQKPLYARLKRILKSLRSALEREGIRWEQVADLLDRPDLGWGF